MKTIEITNQRQHSLIEFLKCGSNYQEPVETVTHLETHISHIFLAGAHAFKLKKPVTLSFLDFSDEKTRKKLVERELVLNKRYAELLYEEVRYLKEYSGTVSWSNKEEAQEAVLQMKRFEQRDLFYERLKENDLSNELIAKLIKKIARFHKTAERKPECFSPEIVHDLIQDCLDTIPEGPLTEGLARDLSHLQRDLYEKIRQRQSSHVRLLHGDLHLGNICVFEGEPYPFDGIEFGEKYAAIDTIADLAFLLMDFLHYDRPDLFWLSLNEYLEQTFDYTGVALLPLYLSYRALVRAKVSAVRQSQEESTEHAASVESYVQLASSSLTRPAPLLIVVGGFSGSGKTTVAKELSRKLGCIHLRSDVFRKHLAGVSLSTKLDQRYYDRSFSQEIYSQLYEVAHMLLKQSFSVIIDAVHGSEVDRARLDKLRLLAPREPICLWCTVDEQEALNRLANRSGDASDADSGILHSQLQHLSQAKSWNHVDTTGSLESTISRLIHSLDLSAHVL